MREVLRKIFSAKKDEEIYREYHGEIKEILKASTLLEEAIEELSKENHSSAREIADQALKHVKKSETVAKEAEKDVARSVRDPSAKEELIRFIHSIESVGKSVEATTYRIKMVKTFRVPKIIKEDLQAVTKYIGPTIEALKDAVYRLPVDPEGAVDYFEKIHECEEKVDDCRRKLIEDFLDKGEGVNIADYHILFEIVKYLERIADSAEETGKIIEIIGSE